jgi:hypothetical protein
MTKDDTNNEIEKLKSRIIELEGDVEQLLQNFGHVVTELDSMAWKIAEKWGIPPADLLFITLKK